MFCNTRELIGANLTQAELAEVVELKSPGAISPELLAVHFVILARELRVGPSNIVESIRDACVAQAQSVGRRCDFLYV